MSGDDLETWSPTVQSCSLVCRRWYQLTRPHLLPRIRLKHEEHVRSLQASNDTVLRQIRHLRIVSGSCTPALFASSLPERLSLVESITWQLQGDPPIAHYRSYNGASRLPASRRQALLGTMRRFASLVKFTLEDCDFPKYLDVLRLAAAIPQLEILELKGTCPVRDLLVDSNAPSPATTLGPPPRWACASPGLKSFFYDLQFCRELYSPMPELASSPGIGRAMSLLWLFLLPCRRPGKARSWIGPLLGTEDASTLVQLVGHVYNSIFYVRKKWDIFAASLHVRFDTTHSNVEHSSERTCK